jgi:hypothetical protein
MWSNKMEKTDYKKVFKEFYKAPTKPVLVTVPEFNFLMIDGMGDPNTSQDYADAMEALYGVAYTTKFALKHAGVADFSVMPLEGLWWIEGQPEITVEDKDNYSWTSMIMQPDVVSKKTIDDAIVSLKERKDPVALPKLRFESYNEGLSVQIMHIGPWSEEKPTIDRLHAFADEQGFKRRGLHHEIYLSDPRRTAPERLKTIIRQPVE